MVVRLAAVPWLVLIVLQILLLGDANSYVEAPFPPDVSQSEPDRLNDDVEQSVQVISDGLATVSKFLLLLPVWIFITLWIVVGWHRYTLLQEEPAGFYPRLTGDRMIAYLWRIIILCLVLIGVAIPMGIVVTILTSMMPSQVVAISLFGLMGLAATVVSLRISLILPAAAIGENMTLKQSWQATESAWWSFVGVTLLLFLAGAIAALLQTIIVSVTGGILIGAVVAGFVQGMFSLFNVSILTTLYGHYAQGRELYA